VTDIELGPRCDARVASILVVNSNATPSVTAQLGDALADHIPPSTRLTLVNPDQGPQGIDSALDLLVSGYETVRLIAAARDDYDAFVIACGNDPGLAAARQVTDRPVVGLAEAGMFEACLLGATFAIPVFSAAKVTLMRQLVASYGLASRLAAVVPMSTSTAEAAGNAELLADQLCAAGVRARDEHQAEVLVLTGSVMARHAAAVSTRIGIPAVAGLHAAVRAAASLAAAGARTSQRFTYRTPTKADSLVGHDDLQHLYSRPATDGPDSDPGGPT
jgi:allantoin racemase